MQVHDFLQKLSIPKSYYGLFKNINLKPLIYRRRLKTLEVHLDTFQVLPFDLYELLIKTIKEQYHCTLDLNIHSEQSNLDHILIANYLSDIYQQLEIPNHLRSSSIVVQDNLISIIMLSSIDKDNLSKYLDVIHSKMKQAGFLLTIEVAMHKASQELNSVPVVRKVKENTGKKKQTNKNHQATEPVVLSLAHLVEEMNHVKVKGVIFRLELRQIPNQKFIANFLIHSGDDAIECSKYYENESDCTLEVGKTYFLTGDYIYSSFARSNQLRVNDIELTTDLFHYEDLDPIKRVELHTHTNFSEMDGVSTVEQLIQQAYDFGHPGLAITDHMVVHSFPKAQRYVEKLLKKNPEKPFKVLYGIEMNMVDDALNIISKAKNQPLQSAKYCVFDLETTGLSAQRDQIIEIGAVKIVDGQMVDRFQSYIKPTISIPSQITAITKIDDQTVKDAPHLEECFEDFLKFVDDSILVAHNASFDMGFLHMACLNLGYSTLENTVINTLDLARTIITDRTRFNLGTVARYYKIPYDQEVAHRADYDAQVLSQVFLSMINTLNELKIHTTQDLLDLQTRTPAFDKLFKYHVNVIAKNKKGLKRLYDLVSISHSDTLMFNASKAKDNDEVQAEPRIYRSVLNENRGDILIGSSCYNSKLFDIAQTGNLQQLEDEIQFYDYIEIQPLGNYQPLLDQNSIFNPDDLVTILTSIIELAQKHNKLIVATGDVHYQLPHHKIFREVYINSQGIGGVRHPLYLYDDAKRAMTESPNQHLFTTLEMLEGYPYLPPEIVRMMVSDNTFKILELCDTIQPIPDKLYTPEIEGSDDQLMKITYAKAYEQYGNPLPTIVHDRLKKELHAIMSNGYGVIYLTSHLLVKKSLEAGYMVGSRGSIGSSLVATMMNITEVNPLPPHYYCSICHISDFEMDSKVRSGYDLENRKCPQCAQPMQGDGQNIPFETFLGFEGDKVPDIDLNFSSQFQEVAHSYTKEIFGEDKVLRAGTIGTVAQKTAFGYVSGYFENVPRKKGNHLAFKEYLADGAQGVKRTTGQHPGGILVIPKDMEVNDFTPTQFPANNPNSSWKTSHYEFHDIHDNILKLDILGHIDPTAMRFLEDISGIDVRSIPMNDQETLSLFTGLNALKIDERKALDKNGAVGLPEFGTPFVRKMLDIARPKTFSDLVQVTGLAHGTDVWANNAQDLITKSGLSLQDVIGCRDDIMTEMIARGLAPKLSFQIMEDVRKGRKLTAHMIEEMKKHQVPDWYIESCDLIQYLFPKAHAVAYCIMGFRVAWFKVHHPLAYYAQYFSLRAEAFDLSVMLKGTDAILKRIEDINSRLNVYNEHRATNKERNILASLEVALEMYLRGYRFSKFSVHTSPATSFSIDPNQEKSLLIPFNAIDGLGSGVAESIVSARDTFDFISIEDISQRTLITQTSLEAIRNLDGLIGLQESNQMSLF